MQSLKTFFSNLIGRKKRDQTLISPSIYVSVDVLNETARLVATFGSMKKPHEGIVYWAGFPSPTAWTVMTVIAPEAETTPGSFRTSISANAYVVRAANELRLQVLAQVHGHPTDWVEHSDGDNRGAFMPYEGFFSIILPWYGRKGIASLEDCGIHQFEKRQFRCLGPEEVKRRFIGVPRSIDLRKGHTS